MVPPSYLHGSTRAYEALGLHKTAQYKQLLVKQAELTSGALFGLLLGASLGLGLINTKSKQREQYPYRLERNPLYYRPGSQ
jgi:hypothetical protein